jgi:hypothetical protein
VLLLLLTACGGAATPEPAAGPEATRSPTPTRPAAPSRDPDSTKAASAVPAPDPRWRFYSSDRTPRSSPWFEGRHPVMIGYGCTVAPYYDRDPAVPAARASTTAWTWRSPAGRR